MPQIGRELKRNLRLLAGRERQRVAQILRLDLETSTPLVGLEQPIGVRRDRPEVREMAAPGSILLTGRAKALQGEVADALEQAVASDIAVLVTCQQPGVEQITEQVEHGLTWCGPLPDCSKRPVRRRRESTQERPRVFVEQLVAPIERSLQGAVPRERARRPHREECEAIGQPVEDLAGRKHPNARGGQLDREREPVEAPTDLCHHRRPVGGEDERGQAALGPLQKEAPGLGCEDGGKRIWCVGGRER